MPLVGADGFVACWDRRDLLAQQRGVPVTQAERLLRRYGSEAAQVLAAADDRPSLLAPVAGAAGYLGAEVLYAATHEGARHLDDVLFRRTRAAIETSDAAIAAAPAVAHLLAPVLGWDKATEAAELEEYRRQAGLVRAAAYGARTDEEADQLASATPSLLPFP